MVKRLIAWLLILLCILAFVDAVRGQTPSTIQIISRSQDAQGVHLVYLVIGSTPPTAEASNGTVRTNAVQSETGLWRVTITATIAVCGGVLWINQQPVAKQSCRLFPSVVRESNRA